VAALVLLLSGCTSPADGWVKADLPGLVQDAVDCGGRWYVAGTVTGPGDATRPAAWDSTDGRTWHSMAFTPLPGSYYGPQDVISSVGCANGLVAMVGGKPGGAHGIPRISTWRLVEGHMAEVAAPFETYGGDEAVNVGHIVGGPRGFIITGNRTSGAALWLSPDGKGFRLVENHRQSGTLARDAAPAADGQWVVVGATAQPKSLDQAPAVWLGDDWRPATVPSSAGYNELQRATRLGDDIVAVGPRGTAFGAWIGSGTSWAEAGSFGDATGTVISLTAAGTVLFALVQTSDGRALWRSGDRGHAWSTVTIPTAAPTAVAGRGSTVLLVADGHVWTTVV
jgi:hypothetical protein